MLRTETVEASHARIALPAHPRLLAKTEELPVGMLDGQRAYLVKLLEAVAADIDERLEVRLVFLGDALVDKPDAIADLADAVHQLVGALAEDPGRYRLLHQFLLDDIDGIAVLVETVLHRLHVMLDDIGVLRDLDGRTRLPRQVLHEIDLAGIGTVEGLDHQIALDRIDEFGAALGESPERLHDPRAQFAGKEPLGADPQLPQQVIRSVDTGIEQTVGPVAALRPLADSAPVVIEESDDLPLEPLGVRHQRLQCGQVPLLPIYCLRHRLLKEETRLAQLRPIDPLRPISPKSNKTRQISVSCCLGY